MVVKTLFKSLLVVCSFVETSKYINNYFMIIEVPSIDVV